MLTATLCLLLVTQLDGGVEASREVFLEVEAALKANALQKREFADCTQEFSAISTFTDARGVVRMVEWSFGSGDSSHRAANYYDNRGRLRFLFVKVGSVPNAWVEARWWLAADRKVLRSRRASGGEGYTGSARDIADYQVLAPEDFVRRRTRCDAG